MTLTGEAPETNGCGQHKLSVRLELATNNFEKIQTKKINQSAWLPRRQHACRYTIHTLVHIIKDPSIKSPAEFEPSCRICRFTVEI